MKQGKVYLVGAGPGDPGLITRKGLECLSQADVIIYDRLLDEQLLNSAPMKAERIYVGKAAGKHTKKQSEINQLLVDRAKEGNTVVRLKGGDPFVLGRGGEEAKALAYSSIPFEVVSGVSSAVVVPAYAGIPVTHRGLASSFAVITGHEDPSKNNSSIAWEKLATGVDTLVFLMGMRNLSKIVEQLLAHGRPANTPIAVIKDGTTPRQKTVVGSLTDIEAKVKKHRLSPPAVIVVGGVVRLRKNLRWFDNQPLFGKRILVTRARHQAGALSRLLSEHGAQPIELPAIEIQATPNTEKLDQAISNLEHYQWIVFTSVNGVEAFFQRLNNLNLDSRALKNAKIGAIGPATAQALARNGIIPDCLPDVYTSQGFIAGLRSWDITEQRFLLPRADIADKELNDAIIQLGGKIHEVAVYKTVPAATAISRAREVLLSEEIDVITFTSSSTVSNLVAAFKEEWQAMNRVKVACIGPKTAEAASRAGLRIDIVASEHTIPGLVAAIEEYYKKDRKEA